MKKLNYLITLLVLTVLLLQACKKDPLVGDAFEETATEEQGQNVFNISDQSTITRSGEGENIKTILGDLRNNPFTVEKMAQAHRNLYGSSLTEMEATHLYIKFMPSSWEDMATLSSSDVFLLDFPLEYEIVEMGDYYQEIGDGSFPVLYTVVSLDFVFPNVDYEIIERLYLDKSDPLLIAESFILTGNADEITSYVFKGGLRHEDLIMYDGTPVEQAIDEPECPPGCEAVLILGGMGIPPEAWEWDCDCTPPPQQTLNECGCPVFASRQRKPGGCVNVEDTELSTPGTPTTFLGVRNVRVIAYDGYFNFDETETDEKGCWNIDDEYHGNAWFWIKYKNNRCKIRGTENNSHAFRQWLFPIVHYVGKLVGPTYNNISVNYSMYTASGSQAHRFWGAATVNNAVHEFHDYSATDLIAPPPNDLDIYIGHGEVIGYAIMSVQNQLSASVGAAMGATTLWAGPFTWLTALHGWAVTMARLPDVFIGTNYNNSDGLKQLAYHEIAHASHFNQVGSAYWRDLVTAEIIADGHGDMNSDNAGLISVCESWAEYIGQLYADRTYGGSNSIPNDWLITLERTRDETISHVPVGLYHDLVDIGEPTYISGGATVSACNQDGTGCIIIPDAVSGFTNAQMFSCLTSGTFTVNDFRGCLITNHLPSTGNTAAAVLTLFGSY